MTDQAHVMQSRILDANGNPVAGARVNIYATGTFAQINVYLDAAGTILTTNPVFADANGAVPQLFVNQAARIVVETASAATLYTLDPAPLSQVTGSAAMLISFAPTTNVPFSNVQDAIEGLDASLRGLILAGGAGVTGDATLLANIDTTTTAGGSYRFASTTTGTFPAGVLAATTGLVHVIRQSATKAVMYLLVENRVFRRTLLTTWGVWYEVVTALDTAVRGTIMQRGEFGWVALATGLAAQQVRVNAAVNALEYFTPKYVSPETVIANGTEYTFTHGLGVVPDVACSLKCVTTEHGYVVGEYIELPAGLDTQGSTEGISIRKSATDFTVRIAANGPLATLAANSATNVIITAANWVLVATARV